MDWHPLTRLVALGLCLVAAGGVRADAQRRLPPGAGLIGQVVDAVGTRQGIDRALVTLAGTKTQRRILTDSRGRFMFTGLPDGEYVLTAARLGYLDGAFGQRRSGGSGTTITVIAGQWLTGVEIPVWRPGVITGSVSDSHGDALEGLRVQAFRRTYLGSQATLDLVAEDTTDDTGTYRLGQLHAEEHVVRVDAGDRTYYPTAARPSQAQVITPQAGRETAGISFFLQEAQPTQSVRGTVVPHVPAVDQEAAAQVPAREVRISEPPDPDLLLSDMDRVVTRVVLDEENHFIAEALTPGRYVIEVDLPAGAWVREDLDVRADRTLDDLVLEARPGLTVHGTVTVTRSVTARPVPSTASLVATLMRANGARPETRTGGMVEGRLTVGPVRPGAYVVSMAGVPAGWSVAAIDAGGVDALSQPVEFSLDRVVPELRVTLTDRSTAISGLVRTQTGQADGDAIVLVFPTRAGAEVASRLFSARTSRFGHYAVTNLPPGDYLVAAIDDAHSAGWQSPDRLLDLRRGATAITLKAGDTRIIELKRLNPRR